MDAIHASAARGAASLPPPPPPPGEISSVPSSFHLNAQEGAGAKLPESSEVVVAKLREKAGVAVSSKAVSLPIDEVDTSGIPDDQQVIVRALRGSYRTAVGLRTDKMHKKKMKDVSKKLGLLLSQLDAGEVEDSIIIRVLNAATLIESGDFEGARQLAKAFSKTVSWDDNRHWIQALNRLLDVVVSGR
eukprot:Plantae.Rhodophyta-Palmaria_palmata.ctg12590.p1 GENE.Plantae.Rhodophyta-Palmaria_palmata.ctg12590~~Plantae.Rhodophyta-Palmaria_palmata.ctg12590.p1  ORF type:complete len:188 (-),score=21.40 Plantae.Rhodophyta-Palmaria_palmata.ctg12590:447-1010(-)